MQRIFDANHVEVAPPLRDLEECWYLPIFGVYHPKKPDQIRGVFDSSAKYDGVSLNSVLLSGPDLTNSLLGVLLRFRKNPVAITADIQQMFHCFLVKEEHRNFLRFLWYENNDPSKELKEYRMRVHVFGNSPSPAVATYGLRRTAEIAAEQFGVDVKEFVQRNFYVDDGLQSLPTSVEAIDLLKRTQEALKVEGNLRLHKIASNSQSVMNAFPTDDLAKDLKDLDFGEETLPLQRSLGLSWDLESDAITFRVSSTEKPYTRRGILSTVNSLFDPLGLVAPVTIQGKLLLRKLTAGTTDWDEPLPESHMTEWETWKESLKQLELLQIPRTYSSNSCGHNSNTELHVFCDASEKAIAAVAYLKTLNDDGIQQLGFVLGKAKVAPLHGHTIPRLELCAAVLAVEIAEIVTEQLDVTFSTVRFYTDSKVVLGYIRNRTRRFYMYVSNRVERITSFTDPEQWSYVPTSVNPADHATRSIPAGQLKHCNWLSGPSQFLAERDEPQSLSNAFPLINCDEDKEVRPQVNVLKTNVSHSTLLGSRRFERFSSWKCLVETIARLKHIAKSYHAGNTCKGWHLCANAKTVDTYREAEQLLIRTVQQEVYTAEMNCILKKAIFPTSSNIVSLDPIIDEDEMLRVGGRLNRGNISLKERNPLIIPGNNHIARLIVLHYHEKVMHQGRHLTEGAVREAGYWITGCKRLISSLLHKCVKCRKLRGTFEQQKMSDLPSDRLEQSPPFTNVGLDTFGPWMVVTRRTRGGQANSKRWAILFTCLAIRAIHIEVVEEMSASSFINALRRFISLRGRPKIFRSDRGTNFVGSTDQLKIDAVHVDEGAVKKFLYDNGTIWRFNPPHSSHMGGVWERMIGIARRILDSMLLDMKSKSLTHEVLTTLMAEVCAIVNARPIVPVSSDPECSTILTPSTLLTQRTGRETESFGTLDLKDMYTSQWKQVQVLADIFWNRWRREYLQTLQKRSKWRRERTSLRKGDVVLLKDASLARNDWPVGIIINDLPGEDNIVRKAEVRIMRDGKPAVFTRPITEMVPLIVEN